MVLVFGGTTEGKQAIEVLTQLQQPFIYSTKTEIQAELPDFATYRYGALDIEGLKEFIKQEGITCIVNASHPFAIQLHNTVDQVAILTQIPVYRLQREFPEHSRHPLVQYLDNYNQIIELINAKYKGKTSLFLTGVQSIRTLESIWQSNPSFFRILDRQSSIDLAMDSNYAYNRLILGLPNKNKADEIELIKELGIDLIFTKESGHSGSLSVKIDSAIDCGIPIYILKKPDLPKSFKLVNNKKELKMSLEREGNKIE